MITPGRHTNFDSSILNIGAVILDRIDEHYLVTYDELLANVTKIAGEQARYNFHQALNVLFLLGTLSYNQKLDAFQKCK